ncbi:hypothetical protein ACU4GR_21410 [Methylobacterium oryzae CBMB20]
MRRATAGDVDARFSAAEDRVAALENRTASRIIRRKNALRRAGD